MADPLVNRVEPMPKESSQDEEPGPDFANQDQFEPNLTGRGDENDRVSVKTKIMVN